MDQRAPTPRPDASRYAWLSAGAPIMGLVLLVSLLALFLLFSFARQQDRDYVEGTRHLISSAVDARARAVGELTVDYANWQSAYDAVAHPFNSAWLEENFYSSVADALIVFRPGESPRYVWFAEEAPVNVTMQIVDAAVRVPQLNTLAGAADPADAVVGTFAVVDGQLAILGIAPITPEDDAERQALAGSTEVSYLITVQFLSSVRVAAVGADLMLSDLAFVTEPSTGDTVTQSLVAADGSEVGAFSWTHMHPGKHGLMNRMWIVVAGLALAGVLTILIARMLVKRHVASIIRAESALESSRLKSEFIATMSHELRTPLNAIIGYAELIQEECDLLGSDVESLRQDSTHIITAGRHLSQLVNDILDQSRLDAGRMHLQIEPLHAGDLIAEIGEIIEPATDAKSVDLVIKRSDVMVLADHARLRQCLMNLAGNAVKFTKKGRVSLSVRRGVDGQFVVFDIADTGIGMSAEELARLFTPFAQANEKIQSEFGGAGLGLAISRKLARAMGGDISVTSARGEGSTFSLRVPAEPLATQTLQAA